MKAARIGGLIVTGPSGAKLLRVRVESTRQQAKEVEALFDRKAGVELEDPTGERRPRGLPAARQQIAAESLEVPRRQRCLGCVPAPICGGAGGRALDEGAAAISDAAQHIVEKACAHWLDLKADWQGHSH